MLDIKLIREKPDIVRKNLQKRNDPEKLKMLEELIAVDKEWRKNIAELNELRQRRNEISKQISVAKKQAQDASKLLSEAEQIPKKIKHLEELVKQQEERSQYLMLRTPNMLHDSVPVGKDDSENVEVRKIGKRPKFSFQPKNHLELAINLGLIDDARAAKISGHGFFFLKNELVMLDLAILRFALDFLRKKRFDIIEPPLMMHEDVLQLVTDWEMFNNQAYKADGLRLIATSEHPIVAMYKDEILNKKDLPLMFAGVSPCFRKEVGAHGKYTKGLFRMHQFNKVEQIIFCRPEDSWKWFEKLQENSDKLYKTLGLHCRVVNVCTGDIGDLAAKRYDTEVWMADGTFREIGSNSNTTDYQARRLNIKFREASGKPAACFVHTLNNTALATSRTMVAILEQFQKKDGSVKVPRALVPYMGGIKVLKR